MNDVKIKELLNTIDMVSLGLLMDKFKLESIHTQNIDSNSLSDFTGWLLFNINKE